jgi:hypothetical protein
LHKKTAADSDSDSDDTSEQTQPAANGTASPSPAKSPAADADGSDSESDEGLDDEAMLRMDAQLGAAVRASLCRSGGSAKERAAALLALQLRVAALLEDWLKKVRFFGFAAPLLSPSRLWLLRGSLMMPKMDVSCGHPHLIHLSTPCAYALLRFPPCFTLDPPVLTLLCPACAAAVVLCAAVLTQPHPAVSSAAAAEGAGVGQGRWRQPCAG